MLKLVSIDSFPLPLLELLRTKIQAPLLGLFGKQAGLAGTVLTFPAPIARASVYQDV